MPRYFFHVHDGEDFPDEGTELSGEEQARDEAVHAAGFMLAEAGSKLWNGEPWAMHVVDERGKSVCDLNFSASKGPPWPAFTSRG